MIFDLERERTLPAFAADVCIVGAGAAGIVLAAELVRQGRRVLLLESGGAAIEQEAQTLNACEYAGQPHREANIGRFRVLGGTTTAWGGQVLELDAGDFAERDWVPGSGWPFPKEELQPYYGRALTAEGLARTIRDDEEVWREMKIAIPELGDALEPYFTRWCPEPNFARLYRDTWASPNLCVVLHATATTMLLAENDRRISGIRCRTLGGREHTCTAPHYALCLGTIESVRFLLQPLPNGRTPAWNRNDLVGRYFQSHIDYNAASIPETDAPRLRRWFANVYLHGYKYHPKFRLAFPVQRERQTLNIAGSVTCIYEAEQELGHLKSLARQAIHGRLHGATSKDLSGLMRQLPTMLKLGYGYAVDHQAYWPPNSRLWLRVHCEQEPLSASSIALTNARDAAGLFRAKLDWRVSRQEWRTIQCFAEQAQRNFSELGLSKMTVQTKLMHEDGFHNMVFDNSHHDMGGTRMARSAAEGVVDTDLKLHGVDNAYVCSASVFPSSGFSNPTHTLIALAIRLADHLATRSKDALELGPHA
jgi:choline dehydrogenase-like flavoprotein